MPYGAGAIPHRRSIRQREGLTQPQLLIIDEIGYIPIARHRANLFFQLVSRRYERGAIILTSNQSLGAWGEVFGDRHGRPRPPAAPLDHGQHPRRELPAAREAEGGPARAEGRRRRRADVVGGPLT